MFKYNTETVKDKYSTIFNTVHYYATMNGIKEGEEVITREQTGEIIEKRNWKNGVKEGLEIEYQKTGNFFSKDLDVIERRRTFYVNGRKNDNEYFFFDNGNLQAIDRWNMGVLVKRLLYSYKESMVLLDKVDYTTKTGEEYYEDGYTVKCRFEFDNDDLDRVNSKYYKKDGTEMTHEEKMEFLGWSKCPHCGEYGICECGYN